MGHIVRCIALAHMLKEHFEPVFVYMELPEYTIREIEALGFALSEIEQEDDLLRKSLDENITVLDGYHFTTGLRQSILKKNSKLVCVHDYEQPEHYADLIINHAPGLDPVKYMAKPGADFALGLKFAMLRPKFLAAAKQTRNINNINTVFIGFGGSDYINCTGRALKVAMDSDKFKRIIVVTGALFPFGDLIKEQIQEDQRVELHYNVSEEAVLRLMQESDLAIVPSSGMLYEALAAGCLAVAGYFVDNQKLVYERFLKEGLIIGSGNFTETELVLAINEALSSGKILRNAIDGLSGTRILSKFLNLAIKVRPCEAHDCDLLFRWVNRVEVRKNAVNPGPILYEDHQKWFHSKLNSSKTFIYITEFDGKPVGQVRYDLNGDHWLIDYFIEEQYRGLGLGKAILQKTMQLNNMKKLKAIVKQENLASEKAFLSLGFLRVGQFENNNALFFEYEYEQDLTQV